MLAHNVKSGRFWDICQSKIDKHGGVIGDMRQPFFINYAELGNVVGEAHQQTGFLEGQGQVEEVFCNKEWL